LTTEAGGRPPHRLRPAGPPGDRAAPPGSKTEHLRTSPTQVILLVGLLLIIMGIRFGIDIQSGSDPNPRRKEKRGSISRCQPAR
jgi:hypothetical protein